MTQLPQWTSSWTSRMNCLASHQMLGISGKLRGDLETCSRWFLTGSAESNVQSCPQSTMKPWMIGCTSCGCCSARGPPPPTHPTWAVTHKSPVCNYPAFGQDDRCETELWRRHMAARLLQTVKHRRWQSHITNGSSYNPRSHCHPKWWGTET